MNNLNCDIIKDLIPLYLDKICSESSAAAVESHLASCPECRGCFEALQNTEITAEAANQAEVNYMKKVKQHYLKKNVLGIVLLFISSQAGLWILTPSWVSYERGVVLYCAVFSILALGTFLLLSNYRTKPKMNKKRAAAGVLSVLGFPCCIFIELQINRAMTAGTGPFGMALNQTGPFFNKWLIFIVITELLLFVYYVVDAVRGRHMPGILPTVSLMCCTLCMSYRSLLFFMTDLTNAEFVRPAAAVLILAVVLISAELILTGLYTSSGSGGRI